METGRIRGERNEEYKVDPLAYESDIREYRSIHSPDCKCPCPKLSAPVWAAGFVVFDPLS